MRIHSITRRTAVTLGAAALVAALGTPAALAADGDCDPLVSHTPTGSDGDTGAVAITSQTLSSAAGWERVGWEAAADTTVTAVAVVREDSTEHRTDGDLATGTAEQVLELRFCGTVDGGEQPAPADEREAPANEREAEIVQVTASEPADEPADPEPTEAPDEAPAPEAPAEPAPATEAAEVEPEPDAAPPARSDDDAPDDDAPDDPARNEEADDAGTPDAEVAAATPATAPQPTAPVTGTLGALLAGLAALAGARWRRAREAGR